MRAWPIWLLCPFFAGCLALGYPSVSRTPPVSVNESDARAFLVTADSESGGGVITGWIKYGRSVRELPVAKATIEPQWDTHFDYYYLLFPFAGSSQRSRTVLLYRPGYELVELSARGWWECLDSGQPVRVRWKEAPTLVAQEKALSRIVGEHQTTTLDASTAQFAEREYARLVQTQSDSPETPEASKTHERLLARAREFGAQPTRDAPLEQNDRVVPASFRTDR
jgi:hypothetical protein